MMYPICFYVPITHDRIVKTRMFVHDASKIAFNKELSQSRA